jgi:hypothetical protein
MRDRDERVGSWLLGVTINHPHCTVLNRKLGNQVGLLRLSHVNGGNGYTVTAAAKGGDAWNVA